MDMQNTKASGHICRSVVGQPVNGSASTCGVVSVALRLRDYEYVVNLSETIGTYIMLRYSPSFGASIKLREHSKIIDKVLRTADMYQQL